MLNVLLLLGLIVPVAKPVRHISTYYTAEKYGGNHLYCSRLDNPLVYSLDTTPWVAVNVRLFQTGEIECGQWLLLVFDTGEEVLARAYDSGPFDGYYIEDHPNLPIIDLPQHLFPVAGMSAPVDVYRINASRG